MAGIWRLMNGCWLRQSTLGQVSSKITGKFARSRELLHNLIITTTSVLRLGHILFPHHPAPSIIHPQLLPSSILTIRFESYTVSLLHHSGSPQTSESYKLTRSDVPIVSQSLPQSVTLPCYAFQARLSHLCLTPTFDRRLLRVDNV